MDSVGFPPPWVWNLEEKHKDTENPGVAQMYLKEL